MIEGFTISNTMIIAIYTGGIIIGAIIGRFIPMSKYSKGEYITFLWIWPVICTWYAFMMIIVGIAFICNIPISYIIGKK